MPEHIKGEKIMKRLCLLAALLIGLCLPISAGAHGEGIPVGGIIIQNTDVAGRPLAGAGFQIVRELSAGELTSRITEKRLVKIGQDHKIVGITPFWTERSMAGEKQTQVITDETGRAEIYGLEYGTYYLVETKAPEGYNRITTPIRVSVHKYSHLTQEDNIRDDQGELIDNTLHIINLRYTLPKPGELETFQLAAGGVGVLFALAALLLIRRRKQWQQPT